MPNFKPRLNSSEIAEILIAASSYELGTVILTFNPSTSDSRIELISAQLSKISKMSKFGNKLIFTDIANTRPIVDFLMSQHLIIESDRPNLGLLLQEIEKILKQRAVLSFQMSKAQKEILLDMIDPYLEDILNNCSEFNSAVKLISAAFSPKNLTTEVNHFLAEHKIDGTVIASVEAIQRICYGEGNLESTFLRMSATLPKLSIQRVTLHHACINKLMAKYPPQPDEIQLIRLIRILLFKSDEQTCSPFSNLDKEINNMLRGESKEEDSLINWKQDGLRYVSDAFIIMNILTTTSSPDISRIRALQIKFNSPLLANYLSILDKRFEDENRSLIKGLKVNDKSMVFGALKKGEDVNQYFDCGRTPLLAAIQDCDEAMVKVILEYKPDINKYNRIQIYNPIHSAIVGGKLGILKLLLDHGCLLFSPCGKTIAFPTLHESRTLTSSINPMTLALEQYTKNKNSTTLAVIKMLVDYGAGIGFNFKETVPADILNNAVILGGSSNYSPSLAITNAIEFKEKVTSSDYLHWQKIFNQALNQLFVFTPSTIAEVTLVLMHIKQFLRTQPCVVAPSQAMEEAKGKSENMNVQNFLESYELLYKSSRPKFHQLVFWSQQLPINALKNNEERLISHFVKYN